jgi:hypothetical protein
MVEALDQRLDELAEALHLGFELLHIGAEHLHCTGVYTVHCTGVDGLHWSLHWSVLHPLPRLLVGIGPTPGPGLDLALAGEGGGPGFDRPHGHPQAGRDGLLADSLLPEGDEGGLVGRGHGVFASHTASSTRCKAPRRTSRLTPAWW